MALFGPTGTSAGGRGGLRGAWSAETVRALGRRRPVNGTAAFFAQLGLTPAYPLALFVGHRRALRRLLLIAGAFTARRRRRPDGQHARRRMDGASRERLLPQLDHDSGAGPWLRVQPRPHRDARLADAHRARRVVRRSSSREAAETQAFGRARMRAGAGMTVRLGRGRDHEPVEAVLARRWRDEAGPREVLRAHRRRRFCRGSRAARSRWSDAPTASARNASTRSRRPPTFPTACRR